MIEACLSLEPEDRPTIADVLAALAAYTGGGVGDVVPTAPHPG